MCVLYGCDLSYVSLQCMFFSRKQQEGQSLQEFSLALMGIMDKVRRVAPDGMPNADILLRNQFIEYVNDFFAQKVEAACAPATFLFFIGDQMGSHLVGA